MTDDPRPTDDADRSMPTIAAEVDESGEVSMDDVKVVLRRLGPVGPLALIAMVLTLIGLAVLAGTASSVAPWLRSQGQFAVVMYAAGFALLAGFALMPTHIQAVVGGWAFGLATGSVGALCGIAGASLIGYVIARRVSGQRVTDLIDEQPKWKAVYDSLIGSGPAKALLIVTLVRVPPNSPFALTNLVLAACRVRPVVYLIGTVIGIAPRTIAAVWIGARITGTDFSVPSSRWMFIGGIVTLVIVVGVIGALANRAIAKVTADN